MYILYAASYYEYYLLIQIKKSNLQVTKYQFPLVLSSFSISLAKSLEFLICILFFENKYRRHPNPISRVSMRWISTGNRRRWRPKETLRRLVEKEMKENNLTLGQVQRWMQRKTNMEIPGEGITFISIAQSSKIKVEVS